MACPICHAPAAPRAVNPSFPFCGSRCKQLDLGKWLFEEYRMPATETSDDDDEAQAGVLGHEGPTGHVGRA
jgi:endogenous inhibitor of DNA gyrase (YacG/DUF329 family)